MSEKRTSLFENGLIWFGAGVSIAEILTGTYLASLGMKKGLAAILLGHLIGCVLLFLAGVIGGKVRKSAMETVKISFGQKGSLLFAMLNVIQLVGWTAIMIYDGALAANQAVGVGNWVWCLVIGGLIILWLVIGITNLGKLNTVAMAALFILTLILCKVIFFGDYHAVSVAADGLTFGAAVELAVAMPLSWLPLISDYTREAKEPVKATAVSAVVYGVISCWMYLIGMGAAIYTGESDIAQIMVKAGLGIVGLLIIIFSTVTTTFLDAYSAGISSETLSHKLNGKYITIGVTIVGALAAIVYPMDNITDFLYLIGSVFAPMIAIQIADFFLLEEDHSEKEIQISNMILWVIGFIPQIVIALVLAAWFTDVRLKIRGQQFFKVVIYLPNLIMASAFALLFFTMFSTNGPINSILMSIGILKKPVDFLGSVIGTRSLIGFMNFLMWFGNTTIMLMAAIMGISQDVFEASDLDGCNSIQRFFYITLPLIRPILAYTLITSIIGGLQMFDVPQILTNGQGNPNRTSMTLIMFLNSHLKSKNYGMAGSLSVYLFIISGILCFFVYRMTNDNDPDGSKKAAKKRAKEERRRARS